MANRIEPAPTSRAKCVTCMQAIPKGEARLAEEYNDAGLARLIMRYYHVRCAVATHPDLLRRALADVRPGVVLDLDALAAKLGMRLAHEDAQQQARYEARLAEEQARAPAVASDAETEALLAQLEDDPDDEGTLSVLGDHLQLRGDPRGELIGLQRALAQAGRPRPRPTYRSDDDEPDEEDGDTALWHRLDALLQELAIPRLGAKERATWGVGFIKRLELDGLTNDRFAQLGAIWRHPSLRVLRELRITFGSRDTGALGSLATVVPRSVRQLELGDREHELLRVPELLAAVPQLETLAVQGTPRGPLAHARLVRLSLARPAEIGRTLSCVAQLSAAQLPALRELALDVHPSYYRVDYTGHDLDRVPMVDDLDAICARLLVNGLLGQLTQLALHEGQLTDAGVRTLVSARDAAKLELLDLSRAKVPAAARGQLQAICERLVMDGAGGEGEGWVEHANQPAWGRGKVVRRFADKLEIEWPTIGKKLFKADAAFLRFG